MLRTVLLLAAAFAAFAAPPLPEDTAPPNLIAVRGPLAPGDLDTLTAGFGFHGDFGTLALLSGTSRSAEALTLRGFDATDLGAWPHDRALLVLPLPTDEAHADDHADLPAGARVLLATDAQVLVSLPHDTLAALRRHDPSVGAGCHGHGLMLVEPRAWTPARFTAPAHDTHLGEGDALPVDGRIAPLSAAVDGNAIESTVATLSSWFTRRADSADLVAAQAWLMNELAAIPGLSVSTHTFDGQYAPNIVAEKLGSVHPERVVVLGAHLDSINASGSGFAAPGADDNASGSAGLLEAARRLAGGDFEHSIRFVWFSAEELGLIGSFAHAQSLLTEGVQPVAMLNMDMIAHLEPGDAFDLDLADNNTNATLNQFVRDVAAAYVPGLAVTSGVLIGGTSDHQAYQSTGIPAAHLGEDLFESSQALHTTGDTLGASANDFGLAAQITSVFVAAAAELAQPVDLALAHTPLADSTDAGGPYEVSVDVTALGAWAPAAAEIVWRRDGGPWQTAPLLRGNGASDWVGSIPGGAPTGLVEYHLVASDAAGHREWLPEGWAPGLTNFDFEVGHKTVAFADDFESPDDAGWTHVLLATQDDWHHDISYGKSGDPPSAFSGTRLWGNDLGISGFNGAYQPDVLNRLTSPSIDTSAFGGLHLRFRRWLTVEDGTYDQATVYADGTPVWTNPATPGGDAHTVDVGWVPMDLDVSALAAGNPSFDIAFELQSDGGVEFGGWNIDDVELVSVQPGDIPVLSASVAHLSVSAGGSVDFALDFGAGAAGRTYLLMLGLTGSAPGTPVDQVVVPLNFDVLTEIGFGLLFTPALPGFAGQLSPAGTATASLVSPALVLPDLEGVQLFFAACTMFPADLASNPVSVTYVP